MLQSNRHDLLGDLPLLNSRGRQRPAAETFLGRLNLLGSALTPRWPPAAVSPFRQQLFDGDVGPHLPGEAREGMLLLHQLGVQLCHVDVCLEGDVQAGLRDKDVKSQELVPPLVLHAQSVGGGGCHSQQKR